MPEISILPVYDEFIIRSFLRFRDPVQTQGRLPGPQVPPRVQDRVSGHNGAPGSERMLSVSGKKKCSHCKEELGKV